MRRLMLGLLLLGGCAGAPDLAAAPPQGNGGAAALAAVGTPLLVAAKIPVCILTLVVASPFGAVSELSDPDTRFGHDVRGGLADGIARNCGPPYAVTP